MEKISNKNFIEELVVENVNFSFGFKEILKDINFTLKKGEVVSIVGPSGGGKTTLLHLCSKLLKLDTGRIKNSFLSSAFAFQEPRLLPWKNVIDNISLALKAKGEKTNIAEQKAKDIAILFGLQESDFSKFPKDLSGGMKQRVSFARALVVNPSLLFLDEPFSALDIGLKKELQNLLIKNIENNNLSILFITHDLMEAIKLSDKIIVLKAQPIGHIKKIFTINEAREKRDDEFVYSKTAEILKDKDIISSFELELK
ncbi:ABC transporter ATP-binding protein [Aliarcobacter cryaerophilus]|uniref:ABC transporter ATP-binding protein n=1 Tax=Aliarcobacter cryaerophilus TaxID=28198 RepID=UPI0021B2C434|nr:ATP-binding cassette domain-containing protein [Aliarcobacter cryaerophilus]MCT7543129.1 ATP-binding cassette domain-containing protein [Aliarcobacter cryaerophilus]